MKKWRWSALALGAILAFLSPLDTARRVESASLASLGAIGLRASDLPVGMRLAAQGTYKTYLQGYTSGHRWNFKASHGSVRDVVSIVVKYRNTVDAAQGAIVEGERQCGSKQSNFTYHPISPQVGDYATGCFFSTGAKNTVILVLRRFSYVAVVSVTGTRSLDYFTETPLTTGYAAKVDRRIEIAVHGKELVGSPRGKTTKAAGKHGVTLLSCNHHKGCLFRAQGKGSAYAGSSWSRMPKSWKFQPSPQFNVAYAFACGHYSGLSDGFELFQRDDLDQVQTLKGIGDARDSGTVLSQLSSGARLGAVQIHVQNSSCTWYVKVSRYNNPFPQP